MAEPDSKFLKLGNMFVRKDLIVRVEAISSDICRVWHQRSSHAKGFEVDSVDIKSKSYPKDVDALLRFVAI